MTGSADDPTRPLSIAELSRRTGLPASTVHRRLAEPAAPRPEYDDRGRRLYQLTKVESFLTAARPRGRPARARTKVRHHADTASLSRLFGVEVTFRHATRAQPSTAVVLPLARQTGTGNVRMALTSTPSRDPRPGETIIIDPTKYLIEPTPDHRELPRSPAELPLYVDAIPTNALATSTGLRDQLGLVPGPNQYAVAECYLTAQREYVALYAIADARPAANPESQPQ